MNLRFRNRFLYMGLLTALLFGSQQAYATLGERADSIAKDRQALSAAKAVTNNRSNYTVQVLTSDANVVREFLTPSGVVFAVAWNGLVHPDLTALLGSYAAEYQNARQQMPRRHGKKNLRVQSDRIVVETWGHMRNLQGRAYLPALIPAGVSIDEIH